MNHYYSKNQLEKDIKDLIIKENRYLTVTELCSMLNISTKPLNKFKISVLAINRELKMKKPHSVFEFMVGKYLDNIFDDIVSQYTFSDCLSPKGYPLRYDFYSEKNNLLIEADGIQHYDKNHIYSTEYTIECDKIKDDYAINNNIKLVRIPYTENVTLEYVKNHLDQ